MPSMSSTKEKCNEEHPFVVHANAAKLIVVGELRLSLRFSKWTPRKFTSSEEIQESNYTRVDNQSTNDDPPDQNILRGSDKALHQKSDNTDIISLIKLIQYFQILVRTWI